MIHDVSAIEYLKDALRETVGPALRAQGFKGSGSNWSLSSPRRDVAIVNVQRSQHGSSSETLFVINLAVVPEPWLAYQHAGRDLPKTVKESHGLWRDRLHPTTPSHVRGSEAWWSVTDAESAATATEDALQQLQRVGAPKLRELLDREALMASIRAGDLGFFRGESHRVLFDLALAVLLADEGRQADLDDVLDRLATGDDEQTRRAFERLRPWVAERVSRGRSA
jgi:hypothetical protein